MGASEPTASKPVAVQGCARSRSDRFEFTEPVAGPGPSAALTPPELSFELAGRACRVVCVDSLMPQHHAPHGNPRARMTYLCNEVAHFDLGGHRYALVADLPDSVAAVPDGARSDMRALLTNRELQIVQFICMGLLTKQVADRLRISEFTVRSYLKTIYCKLGVRSRGAMVYAYAQSLARGRSTESGSGPER